MSTLLRTIFPTVGLFEYLPCTSRFAAEWTRERS
jgi:hypothetical protein